MSLLEIQMNARLGLIGWCGIAVMIVGGVLLYQGQFVDGFQTLILGGIVYMLNVTDKIMGPFIDETLRKQDEIIDLLSITKRDV
jgi:hypothetical protein